MANLGVRWRADEGYRIPIVEGRILSYILAIYLMLSWSTTHPKPIPILNSAQ
jgi:hypothetical protein